MLYLCLSFLPLICHIWALYNNSNTHLCHFQPFSGLYFYISEFQSSEQMAHLHLKWLYHERSPYLKPPKPSFLNIFWFLIRVWSLFPCLHCFMIFLKHIFLMTIFYQAYLEHYKLSPIFLHIKLYQLYIYLVSLYF